MSNWVGLWDGRARIAPNLKAWECLIRRRNGDIRTLLEQVTAPIDGCEPCAEQVFRALEITLPDEVRVIIIGQDPYADGSAMGLAFSVPAGGRIPRSLNTICRVLEMESPTHGDLTAWTRQGVLLLNSALTVRRGKPHSDRKCGWQALTKAIFDALTDEPDTRIVVMLWGQPARKIAGFKPRANNVQMQPSSHPSPNRKAHERDLSDGSPAFIRADHFRSANAFLQEKAIDWMAPWRLPQ